jgi:hypothetical protein
MYGAFTDKPDATPFDAVPNQVPLTEGVAVPPACGVDTLGATGARAASLKASEARKTAVPANERATAAAWQKWLVTKHLSGNGAVPDYANPEQMNRYTWYQTHRWLKPYPGDSAIDTPSQVPGADIPSSDTR